MENAQYEALASLRKEAIKKAKEICPDFTIHIDFNVHHVETTAEVWKFQKPKVRETASAKILVNRAFSRINLFSKEF